eukprot:scaffold1481_cov401-Prasinococcus_capsulatus_cf.AAC.16
MAKEAAHVCRSTHADRSHPLSVDCNFWRSRFRGALPPLRSMRAAKAAGRPAVVAIRSRREWRASRACQVCVPPCRCNIHESYIQLVNGEALGQSSSMGSS